jgi:hypothetical protein
MSQSAENKAAIAANREKILAIDTAVMNNKASIYQSRSMIEENRLMILSNYAAAFMGNRQMANANTDEVFANRAAILAAHDSQSDVEENCINASLNAASLAFLAHRSSMNSAVLDVSEELAEINARLIEINSGIMSANASIVDFNAEQIAGNASLLDGALRPAHATPESNAAMVAKNKADMAEIEANAAVNSDRIKAIMAKSIENADSLVANKATISARRADITKNRADVMANRQRIS